MSEPARRVDLVASGVVSTVGAGLLTGLAPAAALAGPWLLAALVPAAGIAHLVTLSTSQRPGQAPVGRLLGISGRLAAGIAVAGTVGRYATPEQPVLGTLGVVLAVAVLALARPRPSTAATRVAAVVVLVGLALVVLSCFAIAPATPPVPMPQGGSPLGFLAAVGLLTVCFLGIPPREPREHGPRGRRLGVLAGVLAVVLAVCLAVGAAALRQLGAPRLALSPAPLRDALAAADGAPVEPLLLVVVVVSAGFVLLGILAVLAEAGSGLPAPRVRV
ncbi:hypothetical protein BU204_16135, partial [Actinophytocola xanthii]